MSFDHLTFDQLNASLLNRQKKDKQKKHIFWKNDRPKTFERYIYLPLTCLN